MDEATTPTSVETEVTDTTAQEPVNPGIAEIDDQEGMGAAAPVETTEESHEEPANEFLGAPEEGYTDGFNLPEGLELDPGIVSGVKDWCKENNISQKGYQGLIERFTPMLEQRQNEKIAEVKQEFLANWKQDAELGGMNFKQVRAEASKAYEKFVDAETRQLLQQTGLNCHPGIVRAFYNIQKQISDDTVVRGGRPSAKPSLANFFNNSKMN